MGSNGMSDMSKLTVVQLREQLRHRNLPVSGIKPILIQRLQASLGQISNSSSSREGFGFAQERFESLPGFGFAQEGFEALPGFGFAQPNSTTLEECILTDDAVQFRKQLSTLGKFKLRQLLPMAIRAGAIRIALLISHRLDYISAIVQAIELVYVETAQTENILKMIHKWAGLGGILTINAGMVAAARLNAYPLVDTFIQMGGTAVREASIAAAEAGHVEMVVYLIQRRPATIALDKLLSWCGDLANTSILHNHWPIYLTVQSWGIELNSNALLLHAVRGGHCHLIEQLLDAATVPIDYNALLIEASAEGYTNIIWYILELMGVLGLVPDYVQASFEAQDGGHIEAVEIIAAHSNQPIRPMLLPPTLQTMKVRKSIPETVEFINLD